MDDEIRADDTQNIIDKLEAAIQSVKDYIAKRAQEGYHAVDSGAVLSRLKITRPETRR